LTDPINPPAVGATPASATPDAPPVAIEMPDKDDILKRLDIAQQRLNAIAANAQSAAPQGLTQPDPGGTEQWNGNQVWAHMAEFMPYWQMQLGNVISAYTGTPVPFGRTKDDPARVSAIMAGANGSIPSLMQQIQQSVQMTRNYLASLTPEQWQAIGLHARRGPMTVPQIIQAFTLDHLDEHAEQLEALV
jgi:DinB family protein